MFRCNFFVSGEWFWLWKMLTFKCSSSLGESIDLNRISEEEWMNFNYRSFVNNEMESFLSINNKVSQSLNCGVG